ncbi:hypothetical protein [Pseudorhodoferax sp. Leaf274]|uniref:hypothetical protein n=1 Tax=Pseudorhodoferax sp. Leaf274 TaxID=1736318 RepID=UPI0012E260F4|nr:hypothetical protein [Pseudorhodoferax sp. Leaf274]
MTFAKLNAAVVGLTEGLRIHLDRSSIATINTRPPATSDDEVGFLRLTTWSYALLFEAGRTSFGLLLDVPPVNGDPSALNKHKATLIAVQQLRTWLHHNMGFDSARELEIRRAVSDWFLLSCDATSPTNREHWERCFSRLCTDVEDLVSYCAAVISSIMKSVEDREQILATWRLRLQRDWEAHRFDQLVADSAARLGLQLNARAFRERRLSDWRRFLESIPESEDPTPVIERLIDSEVLDYQRSVLPLGAKDIMREIGISPGPNVKVALEHARLGFDSGIRDSAALLQYVAQRMQEKAEKSA